MAILVSFFCQSEYFRKILNLHRKSKNRNSKNIARTLGHVTCELCFSKCKYFNLRRDLEFFVFQIFISKILNDHHKRQRNVCIMSVKCLYKVCINNVELFTYDKYGSCCGSGLDCVFWQKTHLIWV